MGGLAGYSGNPFAKSAKRTFVAGGTSGSGEGSDAHTRTHDSVEFRLGPGSDAHATSFRGGSAAGSVGGISSATRNGIGGVSGFSGNPFGRKAKIAFSVGGGGGGGGEAGDDSVVSKVKGCDGEECGNVSVAGDDIVVLPPVRSAVLGSGTTAGAAAESTAGSA